MIPRPNTAMRVRAPPENRLRKPRTPDDFDAAVSWATLEKLTKGTGTLAPNWYRAMMVSVKMTFLRRSGIRKMLARLESMGLLDAAVGRLYRLVRALPCAGGRPWPNGSGTTVMDPPAPVMVLGRLGEGVRLHPDGPGQRSAPQDLDQVSLVGQAQLHQTGQVDGVSLDGGERTHVDRGVLDAEGVR